jgi:hypothetical protein
MIKSILFGLGFVLATQAQASTNFFEVISQQQQAVVMEQAATLGLNWKVGDACNYSVNMGFVKGTMVMLVREEVPEGFWLNQDVDLGFLGKQKMEALLDKNDGRT